MSDNLKAVREMSENC